MAFSRNVKKGLNALLRDSQEYGGITAGAWFYTVLKKDI